MKIGIDLGGSHIGIGLVEHDKIIATKEKNFTRVDRLDIKNCIINETTRLVLELLEENKISKKDIDILGIACPGTISKGKIVKASNLNLYNFDIVSKIEEKLGIKTIIRNDAKSAALAEKKFGAIKEYDDAIFLSIGTGIGGAVFIGRKVVRTKKIFRI